MVEGNTPYGVLKDGMGEIIKKIRETNKKLNEFGDIVDWGYLVNTVIKDLGLTEREIDIVVYIFYYGEEDEDEDKDDYE